jgi:hypothetical protein
MGKKTFSIVRAQLYGVEPPPGLPPGGRVVPAAKTVAGRRLPQGRPVSSYEEGQGRLRKFDGKHGIDVVIGVGNDYMGHGFPHSRAGIGGI